MTDWSARARVALAQKAQGATPITTETPVVVVLVPPTPGASGIGRPASNNGVMCELSLNTERSAEEATDQARPYAITHDQRARGCGHPWDEGAIDRFLARVKVFRRRGMGNQDAEDIAERLHLRDGDCDDRRLCLECSRLKENGGCRAASRGELHGASAHHQPVVDILFRCEAFSIREGLQ